MLLAVAAGGCLGAPTRYGVELLLPTSPNGFLWSTFIINVSGVMLLGLLVVLLLERLPPKRYVRAVLGTGFLGAYTTFSTYMVQTLVLARDGAVERAAAYVLGTLVIGLLASWFGMTLGRRIILIGGGRGS